MTQPYDYQHVQGASGLTLPFQAGEWASSAVGTAYAGFGMLTARPFFVGDRGLKVNRIGLRLFSAAYTGLCRIGIYACPPPSAHSMYPTTLVADLGDLNLFGSATPYKTAVAPIELDPGFYYVATRIYAPTSGMTIYRHAELSLGGPGFPLGFDPITGVGYIGFSVYNPSGSLPSTFPALAAGNFCVLNNNLATPTAIYMESEITSGLFQAQWLYDSNPLLTGIANLTTNTASQVAVTYGPSTPVATVMAKFEESAHIRDGRVFNVGATTTMPTSSTSLFQFHPRGPLQAGTNQAGPYFPQTAIEVVL
jgi:hypothetical protein